MAAEHPLLKIETLAALAIVAFWLAGVTMIDPRPGVGVFLCAIGIILTIWLFWAPLRRISSNSIRAWPWLGIGLLGIEFLVPSYMLYVKAEETKPTTSVQSNHQNGGQAAGTINNNGPVFNGTTGKDEANQGLLAECDTTINVIRIPESGKVFSIHLFRVPEKNDSIGLGWATGAPNGEYKFPAGPSGQVIKCTVTNYDQKTAIEVAVGMGLLFRKKVKNPHGDGIATGENLSDQVWPIYIGKIDSGIQNAFVFYISNTTEAFVNVSFEKTARIKRLGSNSEITIPVTIAFGRFFFGLSPFTLTMTP